MSEPDESAPEEAEPAETSAEPAEAETPKKKRKKKKKPVEAEAEPHEEGDAPVDDPRVKELSALFIAGDFAKVRELATQLAASSDPRLAGVGRDYLHRTGVDPIQLAFLGLCAAALIAIAWIYIPH